MPGKRNHRQVYLSWIQIIWKIAKFIKHYAFWNFAVNSLKYPPYPQAFNGVAPTQSVWDKWKTFGFFTAERDRKLQKM